MSPYDPIEFQFQVQNDAVVTETAYLSPYGLPWGATLEVTPGQADISPGTAAIFQCRLTLDESIIRPGCVNDQGFRLTTWRVAEDADEQWGSCFYFIRPRVRTRTEIYKADWYESDLSISGKVRLDTDQQVDLSDNLPLRMRVRLQVDDPAVPGQWVDALVQPGGAFSVNRNDFTGPDGQKLWVQAWFDRTDLLASSRSDQFECTHYLTPVIG